MIQSNIFLLREHCKVCSKRMSINKNLTYQELGSGTFIPMTYQGSGS